MNRELKFRGKDINTGEWRYGNYMEKIEPTKEEDVFWCCFIQDRALSMYEVDRKTVGQFSGLRSKGKEVFEGDVFRSETELDHGDHRQYSVVCWIKERAAFYLIPTDTYFTFTTNDNLEEDDQFEWLYEQASLYDFSVDIGLDLCGNIFDNPELLTR
jgi:uncharacterized phage protein (TIGR01671 family)